jgi:hypothetical protein
LHLARFVDTRNVGSIDYGQLALLMRMFGPKRNPTAANLSGVIRALQDKTGVRLQVKASAKAKAARKAA